MATIVTAQKGNEGDRGSPGDTGSLPIGNKAYGPCGAPGPGSPLPTPALGPGLSLPFPLLKTSALVPSQTLFASVSANPVKGLRGQRCAELLYVAITRSLIPTLMVLQNTCLELRYVGSQSGHGATLGLPGTRVEFKLSSHL